MSWASLPHTHMHPDWQDFLRQQGAAFDKGQVVRFDCPCADTNRLDHATLLADLSGPEGLIAVTGPDRREFLQGQVSTDIRLLTQDLSQSSSWNNAKGRVVTTLRIFERGDAVMLALPRTLLAMVIARLRMYVLRVKVQLMDTSDTLTRFGLAGHNAATLLAGCGYTVPERTGRVSQSGGIQLIRLHDAMPRLAVHGELPALKTLWAKLREQGAQPRGNDAWTLRRVLAGEPSVHPATSGHFVAQMLGLEELGAVHFNKGCYLGQEVIARAHYRGAVKRHLYQASCASKEPVTPGMAVHSSAGQLAMGEVVDAARDTDGQWQLLSVLQDEFAKAPLHINGSAVHSIVGTALSRD